MCSIEIIYLSVIFLALADFMKASSIITKSMIYTQEENGKPSEMSSSVQEKLSHQLFPDSVFDSPVKVYQPILVKNVTGSESGSRIYPSEGRSQFRSNDVISTTKLFPVNDTDYFRIYENNNSVSNTLDRTLNQKEDEGREEEEEKEVRGKFIPIDETAAEKNYYVENASKLIEIAREDSVSQSKNLISSDNGSDRINFTYDDTKGILINTILDQVKNSSANYFARFACGPETNSVCWEEIVSKMESNMRNKFDKDGAVQYLSLTDLKTWKLLGKLFNYLFNFEVVKILLERLVTENHLRRDFFSETPEHTEEGTSNDNDIEAEHEGKAKGMKKVKRKWLQPLTLLLLKLKLLIIPTLTGLALVSGKALSMSFLALLLAIVANSTQRISDMWSIAVKRNDIPHRDHQLSLKDLGSQSPQDYYMR